MQVKHFYMYGMSSIALHIKAYNLLSAASTLELSPIIERGQ